MNPTSEIGKEPADKPLRSCLKAGIIPRYYLPKLVAFTCFPLLAQAILPVQSMEVIKVPEAAITSNAKNLDSSPTHSGIDVSFNQEGLSSTPLLESPTKWDNESSSMRGLLLTDHVDNSLQENITQAQTSVSSKNSTVASGISKNDTVSIKTEGNMTEKIRSLAVMLSVIALPPALVVGLLFYRVRRRNKKYAHRHLPHQHSWQS